MLRRAASNAYSWWWASHVRTKQSKWLEENLQDIEEKVEYALKLLEDEGDSFAKRAEMYYKRRPELISFVEESFKAYRALAERYDHISKELQNANTTIASVFPDQVPEFAMNEDDDDDAPVSPRHHKNKTSNKNVPKVPDLPIKDPEAAKKMFMSRKAIQEQNASSVVNKSGLSKTEAVEEIDKLQKEILVLQTEKEFVKTSYENGLAKYWEIEKCIMEKQGKVSSLQDEFDEGAVVIEDKEAQILMSTTALKSCQEKLEELRDKQEQNVKEVDVSRKQISESTEEFGNLSDALLGDGKGNHEIYSEKEKLESLGEKVNDEFDDSEAKSCLTIPDVADKIDELVNDVINLENLFSSQAALIHRLREEIDDLKAQIRALQKENNSSQTDDNMDMGKKLKEMEEKVNGVKDIDQEVEEKSDNIDKHLTRAHMKLSFLSKRLKSLTQEGEDEELKATNVPIQDIGSLTDTKFPEENIDDTVVSENALDIKSASEVVFAEKDLSDEVNQEEAIETKTKEASLSDLEKHISSPKSDIITTQESSDELFLQKLLAHGIEGREKHLLTEYTKVLRNYKEVKKLLHETETKLKNVNTLKDEGKDQQRGQLFMLICREDNNATNAITGQKQRMSPNEEQLGARVDALLSENLNLLVRFSNSFGKIQQFDTGIKDLHGEMLKIIKQKNQDGGKNTLRSNVRPIYKHLSEIRTEMTVWLEKSLLLKEEINIRASTLSDIHNEITEALKTDSEDSEIKFTIYQGAKFEGEVSNMKKENNRIAEELQTGLDQVTKLMKDADTTLEKLSEEFSLSESNTQSSQDRSRIPLRSFIFDRKPKKQRLSLFSCIQPSLSKMKKPAGS
ncbi:Kinase interacting (KIP1-like) family protein [Arabidopsis thaliana]|uniref:Protein NETWORKED 2C n=1 Tax=Arabidopsis thaliana TaxID=3702 RepID=NET2C_ARATH|nr:Kinase interacting (KIP1-like) family protein [Arabidopsis thaliana]Q8LPQ1.1 RecName: Full=Protein NETWORKED 2C [Arabidopsis thaliana]AAM19845.1 AT5g10500/F12B17_150 [Arabidopsis thaliana]AAN72306.1 At5g10500/F12B17_150 [Arabidopsis thaliana]AED91554.1 Kinase interacting (KIP1-like) family protein [Arabidopsis thaliana]|eukprot:NP_196612.2 Kinase interacting (KIP1-like) family protein [Arabidopsis thaliana]